MDAILFFFHILFSLRYDVFFQQISPPKQTTEVFATKTKVKMPKMPPRPWMGERPSMSPFEAKPRKLVVVRGRVQTKASVESEDSKRDAEALVPINVSEKAVFVERTQTVCRNSKTTVPKSLSISLENVRELY